MSPLSPCVGICLIDPKTDLCLGCGRTLPEIVRWPHIDDRERRAIMAALAQRMTDAGLAPPEV